ncbi:MAG: NADH-quinone oxidoreductase subunit J [Ruminococcaceae bacterium]|nr:NADH-quinone oxidoreductase subunit J [Oscillospiraceae bacterium]
MTYEELKQIVRKAGVAGAGGAGFPTYAKLSPKADTIILNCAECEPLFKVHRQLLEQFADEICHGLNEICIAVDAQQFIIAVKEEYKEAVAAVKAVLPDYEKGKLSLLPEIYPAGDEVVTIYEATGRQVPAGNLPISVGVTVFNVETVLNIDRAICQGAPVTTKYVTVAGEVNHPQTYCVPLGTTFEELIKLSGGVTVEDYEIISGGPMTGVLSHKRAVVTKTTNGILVMPENHVVVQKRKAKTAVSINRAKSSCCHCRMCTDLCPRFLLGQPVKPHELMNALARGGSYLDTKALMGNLYCVSCGVCEMYACQQGLNPRSLIADFKDAMRKAGVKPEVTEKAKPVHPHREERKVAMQRLKTRLGLTKYDLPAPVVDLLPKQLSYTLPLSQSIGAPAEAIVKEGQKVAQGELIGSYQEEALSLPIYASVGGVVTKVTNREIIIKKED